MKTLVVDPINTLAKICSFTEFRDGAFYLQKIVKPDKDSIPYGSLCFDVFKYFDNFSTDAPFCYDVKILYELSGYKFDNCIDLGRQVLGHDRLQRYTDLSDRVNAHLRSYRVAKINPDDYEVDTLLPRGTLEDLYRERASVIHELYDRINTDENKDIFEFYTMWEAPELLYEISQNQVNVNLEAIKDDFSHHSVSVRKAEKDGKIKLKFNAVGAKTGRLSFKRGSVNLYNMPKSIRKCIIPSENSQLFQFDYKSFQPRLAIFSTKNDGFKNKFRDIDDIYSVFPGDRDRIKISFLAWMYSTVPSALFEEHAAPIKEFRKSLYSDARKSGKALTPQDGRVVILGDEKEHVFFQNYITANEIDVILQAVSRAHMILAGTKSKVLFPFHDAVICDIHNSEHHLISKIKEQMEHAALDEVYPVDVSKGENFAEMEKIHV